MTPYFCCGKWVAASRPLRVAGALVLAWSALLVGHAATAPGDVPAAPSSPTAPAPVANDSGLHTFTNAQGVNMKAAIVSISGDDVSLTRDDGQKFTVKISIFSNDDQAYIRQWVVDEAVAKDKATPPVTTATTPANTPDAADPATAPAVAVTPAPETESAGTSAPITAFPTITDADVQKFALTNDPEIRYLTFTYISDDYAIAREWKVTQPGGELALGAPQPAIKIYLTPPAARAGFKFTPDQQAYIKALAAQRAQNVAAAEKAPGNPEIRIAAWDGSIGGGKFFSPYGKQNEDEFSQPYLVDTYGVLKGKTITAICGAISGDMVLCSDGTLAAWGNNWNGRLGNGKSGLGEYSVSPALVDLSALKGKKIMAIKSTSHGQYALCSDGSLYDWGSSTSGAITVPTLFDPAMNWILAAGNASALKGKKITDFVGDLRLVTCSDGTVLAWDSDEGKYLQVNATGPLKGKTIAAISYEEPQGPQSDDKSGHYLVLCTDGTIVHWGFCAIAGIYGPGRSVFDDISLLKWQQNSTPVKVKELELEHDKSLRSSKPVILADDTGVLKGKTVIAIADNERYFNQARGGSYISSGASKGWVVADESTILALCSDGTVACWGAGREGPFPFSVNDDEVLKDALKGKTVETIMDEGKGFLMCCSDGTLVDWIIPQANWVMVTQKNEFISGPTRVFSPETVEVYHYFDGKTILAMDSNAVVFK